jgi:DNA-binding IclR family transcriptional regulator
MAATDVTVDVAGEDASEQRKQVRVLVRAVTILDRLSESRSGIGVSDLARSTGLSKATVHNILETLVATGLALPDPVSKRYLLGSKPAAWGRAFL